jgi:hypothetical protein
MIEASVSLEDLRSLESMHNIDAAKVLANTIVDEIERALKEPGQWITDPALFVLSIRD